MGTGFSDPADDFVQFLIDEWVSQQDSPIDPVDYAKTSAHFDAFGNALKQFYMETTLQKWEEENGLQ